MAKEKRDKKEKKSKKEKKDKKSKRADDSSDDGDRNGNRRLEEEVSHFLIYDTKLMIVNDHCLFYMSRFKYNFVDH